MWAADDGTIDAAGKRAPDDGAAVTKAPDDGAAGGADGQDPQPSCRAPGRQGNSSGHDGEGGPGIERAVGEGAGAPPQAERAPRALAPGGDAAPEAVTSSRLLDLYPFVEPLWARAVVGWLGSAAAARGADGGRGGCRGRGVGSGGGVSPEHRGSWCPRARRAGGGGGRAGVPGKKRASEWSGGLRHREVQQPPVALTGSPTQRAHRTFPVAPGGRDGPQVPDHTGPTPPRGGSEGVFRERQHPGRVSP